MIHLKRLILGIPAVMIGIIIIAGIVEITHIITSSQPAIIIIAVILLVGIFYSVGYDFVKKA